MLEEVWERRMCDQVGVELEYKTEGSRYTEAPIEANIRPYNMLKYLTKDFLLKKIHFYSFGMKLDQHSAVQF